MKAEELELIFLVPPPSGECETCGEVDELRPYGPNGEWVCFNCAMQDEEAAGEKFEELFAAYNKGREMPDFKIDLNLEPRMKFNESMPEGGLDRDQVADYIKVVLMEMAGMPKTWAIKIKEDEFKARDKIHWDHWARFEALDEEGSPGFAGQAVIEGRENIVGDVTVYHLLLRRTAMKAYDFDAVVYDGEVFCVECLPEGVDEESEDVSPIFADSEWDSYPVCSECGTVHDYVSLTSYGEEHLEMELDDLSSNIHKDIYETLIKRVTEEAGATAEEAEKVTVKILDDVAEAGETRDKDGWDWWSKNVEIPQASKEGSMKKQAEGLTDADVQEIVDFLNKDTQRHLDYMHDNPDYANNFSDLPKQENYTSMEYGKKIEGLVKKYDMTVEDLVEALEPEDATCEMFWGHRKLDEDESVVFGFYNIDEEELQFDDGMDVELSVGTIGICSALAMLNDNQFARVQKETNEYLPDKAREDAARPSPNFEIYIGIDGYVAVYRDTEDAVKMIEDWAKDQGKTEEEPEEE